MNKHGTFSYSSKQKDHSSNKLPALIWITVVIALIFLLWAPFQKALFNGNTVDFERPLYSTGIWAAIILFMVGMHFFYRWKFEKLSDLITILIWLIPLTFLVSSTSAASAYFSSNMILITIIFVSFFLWSFALNKKLFGTKIIINAFVFSACVVILFGLANWFGQTVGAYKWVSWLAPNMDSFGYYKDAVMADHNGVRLSSVFQYANAYAAYLTATLLCLLYLISISKKRTTTILYGLMLVPTLVSFILTLSRGAFLTFPIIFLLVIIILKFNQQLLIMLYFMSTAILSIIILNPINTIGVLQVENYSVNQAFKGWGILIVASILCALVCLLIQKYFVLKKTIALNSKKFSYFVIPVSVFISGLLSTLLIVNTSLINIIPENIKQRLENINFSQNSVLERGTFYRDAIKLVSDHPLIGAGGGAWSALYEKYQNNPYVSRQAHNFFLQYLSEVGILGFSCLLLILIAVIYIFLRYHFREDQNKKNNYVMIFYIIILSILIHSTIDFDLSYVYLGILVFISLGGMIANDNTILSNKSRQYAKIMKWTYSPIIILVSFILFFFSAQWINANSLYSQSRAHIQENKSLEEILVPLDNALDIRSYHPDYSLYKFDILMQAYHQTQDENYYSEAKLLLEKSLGTEPYNRRLIEREISLYTVKGQTNRALEAVNRALPNFPWDITLYESNINMNVELGDKARQENNPEVRDTHWNEALATYQQVLERVKLLEQLPEGQLQGREFGPTRPMRQALGQMEYIRGNYEAAENFLKTLATPEQLNDPTGRIIIRWYLAALKKQGKDDQDLYDKLIAADPNEETQIEGLLNAKF